MNSGKDAAAPAKLKLSRAVAVEGRDDVTAAGCALDALIIPTHGFGISRETWVQLEKAYNEKGLIILTDPDHAGEQIRKRLAEKFPDAIHAYVAREDAEKGDDIGVENSRPEIIRRAVETALERAGAKAAEDSDGRVYAEAADLAELGLSGTPDASARRAKLCRSLGIGFGNSKALVKKLKGFGIGIDELKEEIRKIEEQ